MYYCKVFDLTRPSAGVIMIWFNLHNASTHEVIQGPMSHGFNVTIRDANGNVVAETGTQKKQRMAAEFNAYAERLIVDTGLVDTHFDQLKLDAIGYRHPAAG